MITGYFITGTDTDVGKTWATIALMRYFKQQGYSVVGMKPVAAGCTYASDVEHEGGEALRNTDALLMQANASVDVAYELVNPYAYIYIYQSVIYIFSTYYIYNCIYVYI